MIIVPIAATHRLLTRRIVVEARLRAARAFDPERAVRFEARFAGELEGVEEGIGLGRIVRLFDGRLFLNRKAQVEPRFSGVGALVLIVLLAVSTATSIAMLAWFATR